MDRQTFTPRVAHIIFAVAWTDLIKERSQQPLEFNDVWMLVYKLSFIVSTT